MEKLTNIVDFSSALICLILFSYLFLDLGWKDELNQKFLMLCAFNILMTVGVLLRRNCQGLAEPWYPSALHLGTGMVFIFAVLLLIVFCDYVIQYLSPRVMVDRVFWYVCVALAAVQLALSLLSMRTGIFYYIDEGNFYHRGELYWLSQPIPIILHLIQAGRILRYRKYLRSMDVIYLMSCVCTPLLAGIVQIVDSRLAFLNLGITVSLLLLFLSIQFDWDFFAVRKQKSGSLYSEKDKNTFIMSRDTAGAHGEK